MSLRSSNRFGSVVFHFLAILVVIFFVVLVVNIFRKTYSGTDISFSAFLNWLGGVQSFSIDINIQDFYIGGDWGILNGLRNFFNIFAQLFGIVVFLCANLVNCLSFIAQFVAFLFA